MAGEISVIALTAGHSLAQSDLWLCAGIQAAVAGEIPVIALTVGHPRAKLEAVGATHILDDFFQLADLVNKTQE